MSNNAPAFPGHSSMGEVGMTLRDYFAAKAMQAIVTCAISQGGARACPSTPELTKAAWLIADAMLATRNGT